MISLPLASLPIHITFLPDATIALSPAAQFKGFVDGKAVFTMSGFTVDGIDYEYNMGIDYKDEPALLEYLQSLKLQQPSKEEIVFAMQAAKNPFGFNFGF